MKKISYLLTLILFVTACTQDTKETTSQETTPEVETLNTPTKPLEIADVPWMAVVDSASQQIKMEPNDSVKTEDLDQKNVLQALSKRYPDVKIVFQKQQNDTLFFNIPDASYLTQGSGSMGAEIFMAEAVYSFTQIPGIQFINFSFKEGDHASPGTFTRADFSFSK